MIYDCKIVTLQWNLKHNKIWAASWENQRFAYVKTKMQISFAITAKLISPFVFTTRIVQYLYYLNTKFQASSHLQWLNSLACENPHCWFSHNAAQISLQSLSRHVVTKNLSWYRKVHKFSEARKICCNQPKMSRDVRKPVFGVSDQVRHKPGCTGTEDG